MELNHKLGRHYHDRVTNPTDEAEEVPQSHIYIVAKKCSLLKVLNG